MSWREFQLRLAGFGRQEKRRLEGLRLITFQTFMSGFRQPKNPNMTIEQFWPLEGENKTALTPSKISALKKAQAEVRKNIEQNHN